MYPTTYKWKFPKTIDFCVVHEYLYKLKTFNQKSVIILDLSETENIHSSFIGFMIHVKNELEHNNIKGMFLLSPAIRKVLMMMDLADYFSVGFESSQIMRSA